ncbi:hypothetical protein Q9L58_005366 [Maublancomyces gigas]|uniref:Ima1 N-terminal domain-containing protein n=1 Tax=Discina gigas TaxID=1032678 RepID=A0ABR3GID5_9PEZI
MSSIFRRKLSCFYCGHQVSVTALRGVNQYPNGRLRRFNCPDCSADNHLDENGEILDYIPDSPPKPVPVFARRRHSPRALHALTQRTTLKPTVGADDSPPASPTFCRTCLHNQQIVTNAIATYDLPPEDHPDYDEHANYLFPLRRKELEERWPAVCPDCAPKVNDRIRTSNYQVKVASLGQMLARSSGYEAAAKGGKPEDHGSSGLKKLERVVWWLRGGVWSYFHLLMLVWHGSAALHPSESLGLDLSVASWPTCVLRSVAAVNADAHCYGVAAGHAGWIPFSALGFFWIYRERDLLRYPHKKLVGAREYLKLECCIYVFRLVSWYFVAPGGSLELTEEAFARLHLGLFLFSFVSTLFSITCLKLEDPPSFSLRESEPIPGTPSPPASPPQRLIQQRHPMSPVTPLRPSLNNPPPSTGGSTNYSPVKFRARDISPSPAPRRTPIRVTPLSPDAMDWNPTDTRETATPAWRATPPPPQPSFISFSSLQRQNSYNSPFTGALPPAPRAPIRRQITQPTPKPQPVRENFFAHRLGTTAASSTPQSASFSKVAAPTYRLGSPLYAPMAPQRFFLADEATGLETLMGGGLRLDDEPTTRAPARHEEAWLGVAMRSGLIAVAALGLAFGGPVWVQPAMAALILRPRYPLRVVVESVVAGAVLAATAYWRNYGSVAGVVLAWLAAAEAWAVAMRLQRARARVFYELERKRGLEREKEERREREGSTGSERSRTGDRSRAGSAGLGFGSMGL